MTRPLLAILALLAACHREPPHDAPSSVTPSASPALGSTARPASGWPAQSLFHSATRWQTERGAEIPLEALAGAPTVLAMVFTSCRASCPVIMADLKKLEAGLSQAERPAIRIVVVSFDAKNDTPEKLRAFAQEQHLELERWTLLHGDEAAVRELAALLEVRYAALPQGGFDHSNAIHVLDPAGVVVHQQLGLNQPSDTTLARLRDLLRPGAGS